MQTGRLYITVITLVVYVLHAETSHLDLNNGVFN